MNVAAADGVFTLTWDAVEGASKYEEQHRASETEGADRPAGERRDQRNLQPEGRPGLRAVAKVVCHPETDTRETDTGATVQSRYYVSSLD